ncbi:hypothetical protein QCE73_10595 [Caballeronia sp. LZ029]|uniref:hypothetical protein n=1 Tax=Caballeronia sp. LZ029 TaxID=3038564 RepID=UPI00285EEF7E|nr:hypothetical protein [Caballeronia sp. LZ029]MDR5743598.1 hypothetical protein [Caballeronia sp. LZ029]
MGTPPRREQDPSQRLEALMRPHHLWQRVSSLTNHDSDVQVSEADPVVLRRAFDAFVSLIDINDWLARRDAVEAEFQRLSASFAGMVEPPLIQFDDTIAWYLYLCELAIARPYELPTYYSSRALPVLGAIGSKLRFRDRVANLKEKILETITKRRREPDGFIFEILVALSYAEQGFAVTFIPESSDPTPDMEVEMHGESFFVECKRMSSRSQYAIAEEALWRQQWAQAEEVVRQNREWVWIDTQIHVELSTLPQDWLARRLAAILPLGDRYAESVDTDATIRARIIDRTALNADLASSSLKQAGSKLRHLLGGDWVPENAMTSLSVRGTTVSAGAPPGYFSTFFSSVEWASGATFSCDADASIERKARDVKTHVGRAVAQVPDDGLSVLHIAFETLEGPGVESRRLEKVVASIEGMRSMKMVAGIILHSLQPVDSTGQLMVIDETSAEFWRLPELRAYIPIMVVLPAGFGLTARRGNHWDSPS